MRLITQQATLQFLLKLAARPHGSINAKSLSQTIVLLVSGQPLPLRMETSLYDSLMARRTCWAVSCISAATLTVLEQSQGLQHTATTMLAQ
jgi:hypothetical protein